MLFSPLFTSGNKHTQIIYICLQNTNNKYQLEPLLSIQYLDLDVHTHTYTVFRGQL